MELPKDFFTVSTLFTLGGSSTAVWILTSVLGDILGFQSSQKAKKWIGLVLSLAFSLLGVTLLKDRTLLTWVVAIVNGFLIYLTAVGVNTVASTTAESISKPPIRETAAARKKTRGGFRERWW